MSKQPNNKASKGPSPLQRGFLKFFSWLHSTAYRLTGGKLGGQMGKNKVLILTTTGRKTGNKYNTPLFYVEDGPELGVIASAGGSDKPPAWWLNLQSNPEAQVLVNGKTIEIRAEQANSEDKSRVWAKMTERYPAYNDYQKKTEREIPVVILHSIERMRTQ